MSFFLNGVGGGVVSPALRGAAPFGFVRLLMVPEVVSFLGREIDRLARQKDLHSLLKVDHARLRINFSTCCSAEPLTSASILILVPPRSSTSILTTPWFLRD